MEKKTIIHLIYNLGRGGAETMLVQVLKELKEYRNIVIILFDENHFKEELECDKLICLHLKSMLSFPGAVITLKKIIKKENPALVHSHLIWPTMMARLATPKNIPLVTTIHTSVATSLDYKRWYIRFLDKATYRFRKSIILVVSKVAYQEYFSILKLKSYQSHVLPTFVNVERFQNPLGMHNPGPVFKVVAVGALSAQKNFSFLINAFANLPDKTFELHIYGKGDRQELLQSQIEETGANVLLKGQVNSVQKILPQYDLYVMSSLFEGFSLSVLEAMAMRIPLLLSDIPSFKEQCEESALYFDLDKPANFVEKLLQLKNDKELRTELAGKAFERVINNFTLPHHLKKLRAIYKSAIEENE
ncbi:MAG: glycosyltransferase [Ginsengibacter sp.]